MTECEIECPFCGESITLLVDTSIGEQTYIEDCSVCCRPIQILARCDEDQMIDVSVSRS
jgi:hypothetical protein